MRIQPKNRTRLVDAAIGRVPCDLVIRNARIVNVFTGEIYDGDVGICEGFIAHVQCDPDKTGRQEIPLEGTKEYDAKGAYLTPGFIDSHIHIESTMMTPRYFSKAVIPHGTTTVITDPHEIGNVFGVRGVQYMHECSEDLPMRHLILAPSCVPSLPGKENGGADFDVEEIAELFKLPRVAGLAEIMDYYGVMNNAPRMVSLVGHCLDEEKFAQGHMFCIHGREVSAYACGGPMSDHECISAQDARDRLRVGINVDARESSISQDIDDIIQGVKDFRYMDLVTFATDDTESDDILKRGHENYIAEKAIRAGLDPVDAIKTATINAAREAGIKGIGAVAPGYTADVLLFEDLTKLKPKAVFYGGELVAEDGKLLAEIEDKDYEIEKINSVSVPTPDADKLKIAVSGRDGNVRCNIIAFNPEKGFMTDFETADLPVKDGFLDISADQDLKYAAVINRYGAGTIGQAVVKSYGIKEGAVASTVAHDCHNIVVIYDKPENAVIAIERLKENAGGYVSVRDGEILAEMKLPVAGLMSNTPIETIAAQSHSFKASLETLGMKGVAFPLFNMAILPLPVVPVARLTDLGMINAVTQEFLPIIAE
ncbi:MAG: adenine deaminase [Dorea sp.]|jgi:adenine deaminase|nr:adenine deaminase [Dorea sp.]